MAEHSQILGVPNFSEGRSERVVDALEATLGSGKAKVLNVHFDAEHNRSVFTIGGEPNSVAQSLMAGAAHSFHLIDIGAHEGAHPRIGALDVCPAVWIDDSQRKIAMRVALVVAKGIAELGVPVFLYGEMAQAEERRERAYFRRGGTEELSKRMSSGELVADLGPEQPHPTAGAVLITARPPLVAFNLELDTPDPEVARAIAAELREAGGGPEGVRAIGLPRAEEGAQVSVNVHDPQRVPLAEVVEIVRKLAAARDAKPVAAELIGLAPEAALEGYPEDVPIAGFDADRDLIERRLGGAAGR